MGGKQLLAYLLRAFTLARGRAQLFGAALIVASACLAGRAEAQPGGANGPIYHAPTPAMNITGVWWIERYSPKIRRVGGGDLPYNDKGKARYAKIRAGLKDGSIVDEARHLCVPDGIPRLLADPYPFQILQTPGQITILYELNHVIRVIPMDAPMPPKAQLAIFPTYSGHAVGHWQGDTLVIESAGFNDKTFLDATGAPHSDRMKTVERIRKLSPTKLEDVVTVTDPAMFTTPWRTRFVYGLHPEVRIKDYVCGEKHRDISHVPGVVVPK